MGKILEHLLVRMTEVDYQHECSRAELLGLPKPTREEFFSSVRETTKETGEEDEITAEQAEDMSARQEGFRRIGGGLDELNSILASTQKKLNRFKAVCGSFSNLLKLQVATKKEEGGEQDVELNSGNENGGESTKSIMRSPQPQVNSGDSQLSKLDALISKAERAELSLSSQNSQMRKFLN